MITKTVSVQHYVDEYRDQVIDLILPIQREEFGIKVTIDDQPDLKNIPNYYQTGLGNFWVALYAGNVVGTIALLDIGEKRLALRKMFVKDIFRGSASNAARLLLDTSIDWAVNNGAVEIILGTTEKFLAAHRFYEKNGFVRISREDLPSSFPIMNVDTRFYRLSLRNKHKEDRGIVSVL